MFILLVGFALRAYQLEADAPTDVSPTQELVLDGPVTISGGRNKALFGEWEPVPSPLKPHKFYPFMNWLGYALFSLLGTGFWQANFISVLTGFLTIVLVAAFAREHFGRRASLFAALFVAVNYVFITYNRDPMAYTTVSCAMMLSLYLWGRGKTHPGWYAVAGALSAFATLFIKLPAIAFVPAGLFGLLLMIWRQRASRLHRRTFLPAILFGAGGALVVGIWYFLYYRPEPMVVGQAYYARTFSLSYGLEENVRFALQSVLQLGVDFGFVMRMLPLFILAYGYSFYRAIQYFSRQKPRLDVAELVALAFLATTIVMLLLSGIRPLRFQILLIPLMALAAGRALDLWLQKEELTLPSRFGRLYPIFVYGGSVYFSYQLLAALLMLSRVARTGAGPVNAQVALDVATLFVLLVIALGLGMIVTLLFLWWVTSFPGRALSLLSPAWRRRIVLATLALAGVGQLLQYAAWARDPQYTVVNASRQLGKMLDPGTTVLGGTYAPTLALETKLPTVWFYGYTERVAVLASPFTHIAVETESPISGEAGNEVRLLENFPALMAQTQVAQTFSIRGYLVTVYEVKRENVLRPAGAPD